MDGHINLPAGPRREFDVQKRIDRVEGFDVLRGIAAMMVVVSHVVAITYNPMLGEKTVSIAKEIGWALGALGVDLFFVLSGFVVARAYRRQTDAGLHYFEFLRGRMIRLMPIYLLSFFIAVSAWIILQQIPIPINAGKTADLVHQGLNIYQLASNLFPLWANHAQLVLNPPWWTITVEIIAAIAMPMMVLIAIRRGIAGVYGLGLLLCLATIALDLTTGINISLIVCLTPIAVGVAMGLTPMSGRRIRIRTLLLIGSAILIGAAYMRPIFSDYAYIMRLVAMNGAALIILAFAGMKVTGLGWRFFRQLGCSSYTIYAIHYPIIIVGIHLAPTSSSGETLTLFAAVSAAIATILSFPIARLVDEKAIALSRLYTSKKAEAIEHKRISDVESIINV